MSQEQIDYKKKKKLYEALGAKQFKKIVMKVEKVRWAVTKKLFPNFLTHYEKACKKSLDKALAKASSQKERDAILSHYRYQILSARREFHQEQNRNYHINAKRPTEVLRYLEMNKNIHKQALARNFAIAIAASGFIASGVGVGLAATIIGLQVALAVKNWQCINLQNYNICRVEISKQALERRERKIREQTAEKYGEAAKVIQQAFETTKEESRIPTNEEIVAAINNPEQLREMQEWLQSVKNTHRASVDDEAKTRKGAK